MKFQKIFPDPQQLLSVQITKENIISSFVNILELEVTAFAQVLKLNGMTPKTQSELQKQRSTGKFKCKKQFSVFDEELIKLLGIRTIIAFIVSRKHIIDQVFLLNWLLFFFESEAHLSTRSLASLPCMVIPPGSSPFFSSSQGCKSGFLDIIPMFLTHILTCPFT